MLYQLLVSHITLYVAFALATILPVANILRIRIAFHILDLIGVIAIYGIIWAFINATVHSDLAIVSVLLTYILPIGMLGLATLLTRLLGRPLSAYVDRYCRAQSSETPVISDDYWQTNQSYRQAMYRLNLVWGSGQILLAVGIWLLFLCITAGIFGLCALIVTCLFYILLTMWSLHYRDEHSKYLG